MKRQHLSPFSLVTGAFCLAACLGAEPADAATSDSASDSTLGLSAGEEETSLRDLTIEADNRMQIRFERPGLRVEIDPAAAPGLDWGTPLDVLDRTVPDLEAPLLASTQGLTSPYTARPWLRAYRQGTVARFQPDLENVESWRLVVADARGREVQAFEGKGKPPREIAWDGRSLDGELAAPGLVHSYVLEAHDRAGNRRNFAGDSFELPPYRVGGDEAPEMILAGKHLVEESLEGVPVLLLEAASRINQIADLDRPVRVTVLARSRGQAEQLANRVVDFLSSHLLGPKARVMAFTEVAEDAPESAVIQVSARP